MVANMTTYNQLSLPWLRLFVGIIFIFMGLFATILFLSQGFTGLTFIIIGLFCVGIEITKILLCGDIGFYYSLKMPEKAIFSGLIVLCLFCLSLTAETYFLMSGNLADSAKLETTTGTRSTLQKQLETQLAQLDKCPAGYVTKCQKPIQKTIEGLQAEFNKTLAAESEQSAAIAARKFWDLLAKATGASHDNLMLFVNFIRAFLGEVIGLYLCGQFATYQRLKTVQNSDFQQDNDALRPPPSIQQSRPPMQTAQSLPRYSFSNLKW